MTATDDSPLAMLAYALIPLRARDGSIRAHAIVDAADAEDWQRATRERPNPPTAQAANWRR